ncbi:putative Invariant surface glycoprotein [Trypanosoma vivax]|uniref:ISG n=1 Tax=Trypanosoma vivax (strain Y486) TaxID=1055687 RepID=F9WR01_TRYVY|nr:putative Invariant surface glycoprotein [Trypanosoma vivax]CCD19984.1 invariant surface glycoprotein, putative [Trypanosoma vivax Y486]CCD21878.1 ISG [Trypanosoma vivax Y486]|eukprot:CCD19984.1 invariant surface glycoprotein, putative [Trypanosoma vivax Y486]
MLITLVCAAAMLTFACQPLPACGLRIDLARQSYPLDSYEQGGLDKEGAAAICRLHALSEGVPSAADELVRKSERWVGMAERLWTSVGVEWGRLQLVSMKVHGLDSFTDAVARAEVKMTEAVHTANSTMEQVRRHNATVFEAVALAEEEAISAIDGDGSPFGGLFNILERHCGSERCKTSKQARCQNCVKPLMEMFPTTGIKCEQLGVPVARTAASVSAMTEALARWDKVRPKFAEDYIALHERGCEPSPEYSCTVLEDWAVHFYTATKKLSEAEEALVGCARAVVSAQIVLHSAVDEVDRLEQMTLKAHQNANGTVVEQLMGHLQCDAAVPTAQRMRLITGSTA